MPSVHLWPSPDRVPTHRSAAEGDQSQGPAQHAMRTLQNPAVGRVREPRQVRLRDQRRRVGAEAGSTRYLSSYLATYLPTLGLPRDIRLTDTYYPIRLNPWSPCAPRGTVTFLDSSLELHFTPDDPFLPQQIQTRLSNAPHVTVAVTLPNRDETTRLEVTCKAVELKAVCNEKEIKLALGERMAKFRDVGIYSLRLPFGFCLLLDNKCSCTTGGDCICSKMRNSNSNSKATSRATKASPSASAFADGTTPEKKRAAPRKSRGSISSTGTLDATNTGATTTLSTPTNAIPHFDSLQSYASIGPSYPLDWQPTLNAFQQQSLLSSEPSSAAAAAAGLRFDSLPGFHALQLPIELQHLTTSSIYQSPHPHSFPLQQPQQIPQLNPEPSLSLTELLMAVNNPSSFPAPNLPASHPHPHPIIHPQPPTHPNSCCSSKIPTQPSSSCCSSNSTSNLDRQIEVGLGQLHLCACGCYNPTSVCSSCGRSCTHQKAEFGVQGYGVEDSEEEGEEQEKGGCCGSGQGGCACSSGVTGCVGCAGGCACSVGGGGGGCCS